MSRRTGQDAGFRLKLSAAQKLFNAGLYFEAHELLEEAWKKAQGPWQTCLQGFIQLSAGFHKLKTGPGGRAGGLYLLERGLRKVRANGELLDEGVLQGIEEGLKPVLAAVGAGRSFPAPRLKWVKGAESGRAPCRRCGLPPGGRAGT